MFEETGLKRQMKEIEEGDRQKRQLGKGDSKKKQKRRQV